jgi:hypothetical protein
LAVVVADEFVVVVVAAVVFGTKLIGREGW